MFKKIEIKKKKEGKVASNSEILEDNWGDFKGFYTFGLVLVKCSRNWLRFWNLLRNKRSVAPVFYCASHFLCPQQHFCSLFWFEPPDNSLSRVFWDTLPDHAQVTHNQPPTQQSTHKPTAKPTDQWQPATGDQLILGAFLPRTT